MKKARFEDRRLGFQSDVAGEFTMKGAKVGATKGDESFVYAICKPKDKGRSIFVGAGDLQATAIEAGIKENKLPFPSSLIDSEVDVDTLKVNENFSFAVVQGRIQVKA